MEIPKLYGNAKIGHRNNRFADSDGVWSEALETAFPTHLIDNAYQEITTWPGYAPTALLTLDGLAAQLGLAAVFYKDEASRFGLGSFKALGGAYAVLRIVQARLAAHLARPVSTSEVRSGIHARLIEGLTVTTATDGNHGRSVGWGAAQLGCAAVIYIHAGVSAGRATELARYGATVTRVAGNYDDSVARAAADATANGWFLVADTSHAGYEEVPRQVMAGYGLLVDEVLSCPALRAPLTHVFVQGGVGGLAGAVCARLWQTLGRTRPRLVVVEPALAACLFESARTGNASAIRVEQETVMAGLSCGEVSAVAWQLLASGADDFLTIDDGLVAPTMQGLAQGIAGAAPIVAGESAVAGLAAVIACSQQPELRANLGLDPDSRVLVVGTEGATDPAIYQALVGLRADAVG